MFFSLELLQKLNGPAKQFEIHSKDSPEYVEKDENEKLKKKFKN